MATTAKQKRHEAAKLARVWGKSVFYETLSRGGPKEDINKGPYLVTDFLGPNTGSNTKVSNIGKSGKFNPGDPWCRWYCSALAGAIDKKYPDGPLAKHNDALAVAEGAGMIDFPAVGTVYIKVGADPSTNSGSGHALFVIQVLPNGGIIVSEGNSGHQSKISEYATIDDWKSPKGFQTFGGFSLLWKEDINILKAELPPGVYDKIKNTPANRDKSEPNFASNSPKNLTPGSKAPAGAGGGAGENRTGAGGRTNSQIKSEGLTLEQFAAMLNRGVKGSGSIEPDSKISNQIASTSNNEEYKYEMKQVINPDQRIKNTATSNINEPA